MLNFVKFHPFILKILSGNEILTQIKGHKYLIDLCKSTHNDPNSNLAIINVYVNKSKRISDVSKGP